MDAPPVKEPDPAPVQRVQSLQVSTVDALGIGRPVNVNRLPRIVSLDTLWLRLRGRR
jgi:hypothetical protein